MTTIATDGKSMAGDGLVTCGNLVCGWNLQKVYRLKDGRLVGICGSGYDFGVFLKWMEDGGKAPKLSEHFEALVLSPDGSCATFNEDCRTFPEELPSACGSGKQIAIGAMDAGLSPEESVMLACARNTDSGGVILTLELAATELKAVA